MTVLTRIYSLIKHHILITSTNYSNTIQLIDITIQTLSILKNFQ